MPGPTSRRLLAATVTLLSPILAACGAGNGSAEISPRVARKAPPAAAMQAATKSGKDVAPPSTEQRIERIGDLDRLCAALDKDYVDGTLSDYYASVEIRSDWGAALRKSGSGSVKPARELEKAVAELDPDGTEAGLARCRSLLEYIDDVE